MIESDIPIYIGYALGAWSFGYFVGFKIQAIKKFMDAA